MKNGCGTRKAPSKGMEYMKPKSKPKSKPKK